MSLWLFKTDPDTYSWENLQKSKKEVWDGVANPLALKNLRSVKKGDQIFIYHTGDEKAVIGIAKAVSDSYPDPSDKSGKLTLVDLTPEKALPQPVFLSEIKTNSKLKSWDLVRDETWLRSCMRIVAHFAGSSLLVLVDMNIVDVDKSVP